MRVAFGFYAVGLLLLLLGLSGIRVSAAVALVAVLTGFALFVLGIVFEEKSWRADERRRVP